MLVPPDEFGSRGCQVALIMNSPEFEENLRIARAKACNELKRLNMTSSSSSSSSSAPADASSIFPVPPFCNDERQLSETYSEMFRVLNGPLRPLLLQHAMRADRLR